MAIYSDFMTKGLIIETEERGEYRKYRIQIDPPLEVGKVAGSELSMFMKIGGQTGLSIKEIVAMQNKKNLSISYISIALLKGKQYSGLAYELIDNHDRITELETLAKEAIDHPPKERIKKKKDEVSEPKKPKEDEFWNSAIRIPLSQVPVVMKKDGKVIISHDEMQKIHTQEKEKAAQKYAQIENSVKNEAQALNIVLTENDVNDICDYVYRNAVEDYLKEAEIIDLIRHHLADNYIPKENCAGREILEGEIQIQDRNTEELKFKGQKLEIYAGPQGFDNIFYIRIYQTGKKPSYQTINAGTTLGSYPTFKDLLRDFRSDYIIFRKYGSAWVEEDLNVNILDEEDIPKSDGTNKIPLDSIKLRTTEQLIATLNGIKKLAEKYSDTDSSKGILDQIAVILQKPQEKHDYIKVINEIETKVNAEWTKKNKAYGDQIINYDIHDLDHDIMVILNPLGFDIDENIEMEILTPEMFDYSKLTKNRE
jgi:hypothetical protein